MARRSTRRQVLKTTCSVIGAAACGSALVRNALAADAPPDDTKLQVVETIDAYGGRRTNLKLGQNAGFIIQPIGDSPAEPRAWIWYAPTLPGLPSPRHDFIIRRVLAAGLAFAGVDVGESYGSPAGVKRYAAFHDALVRQFHLIDKAVLLPQSRGGLMLYNYAADHPDQVVRIAGIYPVCDLRSYPGLATAAPAYGLTEQQLANDLPRYNPIERLAPLAHADIPILHIHGDADRVVPIEKNSAQLERRYRALGGKIQLIIVPNKGHEEVDEFFTSKPFVEFLTSGKANEQP